ncbi:integrase core domain-containing protein [Actinomyces bowdenii]|uniref:integrase core domain-containing protein n=1 Tax=Actinomyces bowdenii TaxID=131109 RepID=UPI0035A3CA14
MCDAIDMAMRHCPAVEGETIFHSDRGSQYTSEAFAKHLDAYDIRASVGRTGVCWVGAWTESFNATLKNERVYRMVYPTRKKAMDDTASWIERTYNHTKLHSALGHRTRTRSNANSWTTNNQPDPHNNRSPKNTQHSTCFMTATVISAMILKSTPREA